MSQGMKRVTWLCRQEIVLFRTGAQAATTTKALKSTGRAGGEIQPVENTAFYGDT